MAAHKNYDVIIIGGSYSGLAAGLSLGRALRNVLIIDNGKPCNIQTPHSHNFITQDGKTPLEIATIARQQVENYKTVKFYNGTATKGSQTDQGFDVETSSGDTFTAKKLIFATGIKDIMPDIPGFKACWGISVIHCPYCHGYEYRNEVTGILANGDMGFEISKLIHNWTKDLRLFTNGPSTLTEEQTEKLAKHHIQIIEKEVDRLEHRNGHIENIIFKDGTTSPIKAVYARPAFEQHCNIPAEIGCAFTEQNYIKIDAMQKTNIPGVFACGDNTIFMRSVANAVAMGAMAGAAANKELTEENF